MVAQVVELIDVQTLDGQQVLNVYHYYDAAGAADPLDLTGNFADHVIPLLAITQTSHLSHEAIRYRLVYPTADLMREIPVSPPVLGADTTHDPSPSSTAWSLKYSLGSTIVLAGGFMGHLKRGGLRQPGCVEANISGNTASAGVITAWASTAPQLLVPGGGAWTLVVASFLDGARVRQPTVQAVANINGLSVPAPSTQNTRKVLRGRTS